MLQLKDVFKKFIPQLKDPFGNHMQTINHLKQKIVDALPWGFSYGPPLIFRPPLSNQARPSPMIQSKPSPTPTNPSDKYFRYWIGSKERPLSYTKLKVRSFACFHPTSLCGPNLCQGPLCQGLHKTFHSYVIFGFINH